MHQLYYNRKRSLFRLLLFAHMWWFMNFGWCLICCSCFITGSLIGNLSVSNVTFFSCWFVHALATVRLNINWCAKTLHNMIISGLCKTSRFCQQQSQSCVSGQIPSVTRLNRWFIATVYNRLKYNPSISCGVAYLSMMSCICMWLWGWTCWMCVMRINVLVCFEIMGEYIAV